MALSPYALTTVDYVKRMFNLTTSEYDTQIEDGINAISNFIEQYTRRVYKKRQVVEYLTGSGKSELVLSYFPISNVNVYYDNNKNFTNDTLLESGNYIVYDKIGILVKKIGIWDNSVSKNYKIVYDAGYDEVPYALQSLTAQIVGAIVLRAIKRNLNVNSVNFSDSIVKYEDLLTQAQRDILNSFRRKII